MQGCRVPRFQGSKVAGFQNPWGFLGAKVPRFQGSTVAGFQGSRVSGFQAYQGSRVSGFQGFQGSKGSRVPRVQGSKGSRVPGSQQGARCAGLQGSKVPGFQGCRVPESLRVPGCQGSKVSGFHGHRVPRFQGSRVPGFRGSKVSGFQGSRVPGFQGFRVPGFQGSRVPGFQVPFRILKAASPREPAPALEIETQQALLLGTTAPATKKWCQVVRSAAPVTQNHISKPENLRLQNATPLRKSAPGPPNSSDEHVSCIVPATEELYLCRSSSNAPRLPSVLKLLQNLTLRSHLTKFTIPCTCHAKPNLNLQKWSEHVVLLTWKCASRHNRVHFFDMSTSKSATRLRCFVHFDLEMCFAPQRRALFRHLNFQKWSDTEVFCTFWLGNVLRATTKFTFFPPARWGLLDFIRAVLLLLRLLLHLLLVLLLAVQIPVGTAGPPPRAPDPSGHCRTSTARSRSQWALPDLHRELQIAMGTAGPQPRLPGCSGHCRTSTAISRSQWALPDLHREIQIPVGTAGPPPRAPDRNGHCRTSTATSRLQWALPDLNRDFQIAVGTAGPQPRLPDRSGHCRTSTGRKDVR